MARMFKIDNDVKNEYTKMLGVHVGNDIDSFLTLLSMGSSKSRSLLVREVLLAWIKKHPDDIRSLANFIAAKANAIYETQSLEEHFLKDKESRFEFGKRLKQDLNSRKLPIVIVENIMIKFNELKQTDETKSSK
jgi:hypothetical protein